MLIRVDSWFALRPRFALASLVAFDVMMEKKPSISGPASLQI